MAKPTTIEDLERLRLHLKRFAWLAAAAILFGAGVSIILLQPGAGTGPSDVHIPEVSLHLLHSRPDFAAGSHIAGGPVAELQNRFGNLLLILGYVTMALIVWGLIKRQKTVVKYGIFGLMAFGLLRPVSPPMQINPPRAVSVETAHQLVGLGRREWATDPTSSHLRYVLAQIAFLEGDRARAERLAAGLTGPGLASPIEASFRLQFLQNAPPTRTTICYPQGCLSENIRQVVQALIAVLTLLALALGAAAIRLRTKLRLRCKRIETLREQLLRRHRVVA